MARDVGELLAALDLERVEGDTFLGRSPSRPGNRQRVFGGLVVAQALVAVSRTVTDRVPHSLHCYFILPGDVSLPITYEVDRVRDGRSFTTRRCAASQDGHVIFDLVASFQVADQVVDGGLNHQMPKPDAPEPEDLPSSGELEASIGHLMPPGLKHWFLGKQAIEIRPCDVGRYDGRGTPQNRQRVWIRASGRLPDDPAVHRAVLAYLSDMTLLDAALAPHGRTLFGAGLAAASLDHAIWFHRPFRADEWLLYAQDSPSMSGSRGLTRGLIFDRAGVLVATVMQEGLIRVRA